MSKEFNGHPSRLLPTDVKLRGHTSYLFCTIALHKQLEKCGNFSLVKNVKAFYTLCFHSRQQDHHFDKSWTCNPDINRLHNHLSKSKQAEEHKGISSQVRSMSHSQISYPKEFCSLMIPNIVQASQASRRAQPKSENRFKLLSFFYLMKFQMGSSYSLIAPTN